VDSITNDFGDVLLWSFWIFIVIGAVTIWVLAFIDVFADREVSGWAKACWVVILIVVPWLGALTYLVVRDVSKRRLARSLDA